MPANPVHRFWIFTCNNFLDEHVAKINKFPAQYVFYGREVGSKEETPHLQGFFYLAEPKRKQWIVTRLGTQFWVSRPGPEKGLLYWQEYCTKQDSKPTCIGICPSVEEVAEDLKVKQGQRTDLQTFVETVKTSNKRMRQVDVLDEFPGIVAKFPAFVDRVTAIYHPPQRLTELDNHWWYGPPGTGKSSTAELENPGAYVKPCRTKWWDHYDHEDCVILDDFGNNDHTRALIDDLKTWLDYRPFRAEVKGSSMLIRPKKFIITSNYHPSEIFHGVDLDALMRRITVRHFKDQSTIPECFRKK